jgi:hypothetical protein
MTETATALTSPPETATRGETAVRPNPKAVPFDVQRFRSELAGRRIKGNAFARACGMTDTWIYLVWNEQCQPGELSAITDLDKRRYTMLA